MTSAERRVGVVTTAFGASGTKPMRRSLNALRELGFDRAILIVDTKDPRGCETARRAITETGDGMPVESLEVDDYGTARRWRFGIRRAFATDAHLPWVLHLPGDLVEDLSQENMSGLREMCKRADARTLVLGDFSSSDRFKTWFDEGVAGPVMRELFPDIDQAIRVIGLAKRRTEFLAVGRQVLQEHDTAVAASWGQDPTPGVISVAIRAGLNLVRVDVGHVADDPRTRRPVGQIQQIVRFAHQQTEDHIIATGAWRPQAGEAADDPMTQYSQLVRRLTVIYGDGLIMRMLRENLAELTRELDAHAVGERVGH